MIRPLLALLLLTTPALAGGTSSMEKLPLCSGIPPIAYVEAEPDVLFVNYPEARQALGFLKRYRKAQRMAVPCETPRRIRSPKDERCYLKNRLP